MKIKNKFYILLLITILITMQINITFAEENNSNFIVAVSDNGLVKLDIKSGKSSYIVHGQNFSSPLISSDGKYIAYKNNDSVIVYDMYKDKNDLVYKIKNKDDFEENNYAWGKNKLFICSEDGGIISYEADKKIQKNWGDSNSTYSDLVCGEGTVFAYKFKYEYREDGTYINSYGIVKIDLNNEKETLILKSTKSNDDELGYNPFPVHISDDGRYLYIWNKYASASTSADMVSFGVYDIKNNNMVTTKWENKVDDVSMYWTLGYMDNFSVSHKDNLIIALNLGTGREMTEIEKRTAIIDIKNNEICYVTDNNMVTMTPVFSNDDKSVYYAASEPSKSLYSVYKYDLITQKNEKITDGKYVDIMFKEISDNLIIFLRKNDEDKNFSIWKLEDGKESIILNNVVNNVEYSNYYGHYDLKVMLDIFEAAV